MNTTTRSEYKFDDRAIRWAPFRGFEGLDYHVLAVDHARGHVDMLMRFAPNQNCVPHTHVGPTKTLVLEGEHRIYHPAAAGDARCTVRPAGTFAANDGDETHYEGGGPQGAIILLMMTAKDGAVYDILEAFDGAVERKIMLDDFQRGLLRQQANSAD